MRDIISIQRAEKLHPKIAQEVKDTITQAEVNFPPNMAIRIAQGLRTWEEQDALYQQGRRGIKGEKKVTNAKPGSSYHQYGLAIDFVIAYDKDNNGAFEEVSWDTARDFDKDGIIDWQEVVKTFEAKGYEWGGKWRTFKDMPHLQKTFKYTIAQLRDLYSKKKFIPGTKYVVI